MGFTGVALLGSRNSTTPERYHAMTAIAATATAPITFAFRVGFSLVSLQKAYVSYRRFKALDADQMQDMGLTLTDQRDAKFSDFL